jgi:hypothetical protein
LPARVLFRASDFKVRTSIADHARRLPFFIINLLAMKRAAYYERD